jgi:D-tyrosyl-tRNA(Tyr) deacylase
MYGSFLDRMRKLYRPEKIQGRFTFFYAAVCAYSGLNNQDGRFGAMMQVALTNEVSIEFVGVSRAPFSDSFTQGPVTFTLDSRKFEHVDQSVLPAKGKKATPAPASTSDETNAATELVNQAQNAAS